MAIDKDAPYKTQKATEYAAMYQAHLDAKYDFANNTIISLGAACSKYGDVAGNHYIDTISNLRIAQRKV